MDEVRIRQIRNHGKYVLDRVQAGERLTVTRSRRTVAELRHLPRLPLDAPTLLKRWYHLLCVDPARLQSDIDDMMDPSL